MTYYALEGTFATAGKSPDGDTVCFKLDRPAHLHALRRPASVEPPGDDINVRLEGVDAPELHYERGRPVFPKLFRRCVKFCLEQSSRFVAKDFVHWLRANRGARRRSHDRRPEGPIERSADRRPRARALWDRSDGDRVRAEGLGR